MKITKELIRDKILNNEDISELDTSQVTDMNAMFMDCSNLQSIPELDTSQVTDMSHMFDGCSKLQNICIDNFPGIDFSTLKNKYLKDKYPEYFI